MPTNRTNTFVFRAAFPGLIILTVLAWQFRFRETGTVFFREASLSSWVGKESSGTSSSFQFINDETLQITPNEVSRSSIRRSWLVENEQLIKVRIKHRAPEPLEQVSPQKKYPLLIQLAGYGQEGGPYLEGPAILAFSSPGPDWEVIESVVPLPEGTRFFTLFLSALSAKGLYQVSGIDISGIEQRPWFPVAGILLTGLWATWIHAAVRRSRNDSTLLRLSSLFASGWILAWASIVVFPRPVDIPRPFFDTFQTGSSSTLTQGRPLDQEKATPKRSRSESGKVATRRPPDWSQSLSRIKNQPGGRFLIHFGVIGLFSGILLLIMSARQGLPFIVAIIVGGELVPWLWLGNFDTKDLQDLFAYLLATLTTLPIAAKIRNRLATSPRVPADV